MLVRIHDNALVREEGPPDAPVLILLAGFADNGSMFVPLMETALAERYRLVAVDLPGFGASPPRVGVASLAEHARWLAGLVEEICQGWPVGLVAHSVASCIAAEAAPLLERCAGVFSIEGNLTADDAYFSGKAADHDHPQAFKSALLEAIWERAQAKPILRRYHGALTLADAGAMWRLGRDAKRISVGDGPGRALAALDVPKLYYWSRPNTPAASIAWIEAGNIPHEHYDDASHWPTVDAPDATAAAIARFFDPLLTGSDFPLPRSRA